MRIARTAILITALMFAQRGAAQNCGWSGTTNQTTPCNVGIGSVSAPGELLHVQGSQPSIRIEDSGTTGAKLRFFTGGAERALIEATDAALRVKVAGTERLTILSNGRVGVNWPNPGYAFGVVGQIYSFTELTGDGTYANFVADYGNGSGDPTAIGIPAYRMTSFGGKTTAAVGFMPYDSTGNGALRFFTRGNDTLYRRMTIEPNGNVGIGLSNPAKLLHVGGDAQVDGALNVFATANNPALKLAGVMAFNGSTDSVGTAVLNYYSSTANRQIMFADAAQIQSNAVPGIRFILGNSDYASIDSATPNGAIGKALLLNPGGGNVGIGTDGVIAYKLVVAGDAQLQTGGKLYGNTASQYLLLNSNSGSTLAYNAQNYVKVGGNVVELGTNAGVTMTAWDGKVGIGTPFPAERLHVAGNIRVDGNINAKFQDIAEWVPATEPMAAGSVVVVASDNFVSPSTEAYDTAVAGVVSAQPGISLGEAGESKVLVATTGRVKVRVDTSNGPIRAGDILVSSSIKGVAMKSEPVVLNGRKFHQPGTVIGKALQSLEKGTGEILVLLSMQ